MNNKAQNLKLLPRVYAKERESEGALAFPWLAKRFVCRVISIKA